MRTEIGLKGEDKPMKNDEEKKEGDNGKKKGFKIPLKRPKEEDSITDYVNREQRSFAQLPLNEADSLVFCQLSYMDWSDCAADRRTLSQSDDSVISERLCAKVRVRQNNVKLAQAVRASERFGSVTVGNFVNVIDAQLEQQFSAVCFVLPTQEQYVAFRGTDGTVVGWKEDFNMMYADEVPSQKSAVDYLNAFGWQSKRIYVGGHSKGGNLAIYAATFCDPVIRDRILSIYSHDGPGFRNSLRGQGGYDAIVSKIHKTVPQSSIIGMLMKDESPSVIVKSDGKGFAQHDPFLWKIVGNNFAAAPQLSDGALTIQRAINGWLGNMSDIDRENFVNALFLVLKESGAASIREFTKMWVTDFHRVKAAMSAFDAPTRARVTGALGMFVAEIIRSQKNKNEKDSEKDSE